ncbi:MAG: ribosome biogenesis GTP-binding protein YihA/YsxC [Bacteroidales bacterium]|nr:ribosome biogenesis GTP-binding protein YihA/YsxC [Bacteroidales bacterium]
MVIKSVKTLRFALYPEDFPKEHFPEYAFLGRSNVGKSSLINMILNNKNIAKVSANPGKTKTINFYLINNQWCIVDMPGIGYASVSKKQKFEWTKSVNHYLVTRKSLIYVFYLIDSRLPLQSIDMEVLKNFGLNAIPFILISTKIDKAKQSEINLHKQSINSFIRKYWSESPIHLLTSSISKEGREEILKIIEECNNNFYQQNAKKFV